MHDRIDGSPKESPGLGSPVSILHSERLINWSEQGAIHHTSLVIQYLGLFQVSKPTARVNKSCTNWRFYGPFASRSLPKMCQFVFRQTLNLASRRPRLATFRETQIGNRNLTQPYQYHHAGMPIWSTRCRMHSINKDMEKSNRRLRDSEELCRTDPCGAYRGLGCWRPRRLPAMLI